MAVSLGRTDAVLICLKSVATLPLAGNVAGLSLMHAYKYRDISNQACRLILYDVQALFSGRRILSWTVQNQCSSQGSVLLILVR